MLTFVLQVTYTTGTEMLDQNATDPMEAITLCLKALKTKFRITGVYKVVQKVEVVRAKPVE